MRILVWLVLVPLVACEGAQLAGFDAGAGAADAPPPDTAPPADAICWTYPETWAPDPLPGDATLDDSDPTGAVVVFAAPLGNGEALRLELYSGAGVFAAGLAPGTYTLAGEETSYRTCGACVRLFADVDPTTHLPRIYMATEGTLVLDSVAGRLTGSLTGARFTHVEIASDYESIVVGDCTTSLAPTSFDEPIVARRRSAE